MYLQQGAPAAPLEIKELINNDIFDSQCDGKKVCIIAFLPNILDSQASGRSDYLDIFEKAASSSKRNLFTFSWSEGGSQKSLEKALKVSSANYPAVVALSKEKGKFSKHRGAYSTASLKDFISAMISGQSKVVSLPDNLPEVVSISPWDGKDAKVEIVEEFSLDDVLGEEL